MAYKSVATPAGLGQRSRLAFLLKDSALYGGAAAISKAFALITFPLLARHFSIVDYGVVDFFLVLASFLAILFIFGQDSAVARYFYEHEEITERRQLISQSLLFQLGGLLLFLPMLWGGAGWLTRFLIEAPEAEWLLKLVMLKLPFIVVINFSQNLLKWTFARAQFLTISLGFTTVQALLLVFAVLVLDIGVQGVLVVGLCTSVVFGFLSLYFVRGWLTRPRGFKHLREMLPFAIPYGVICVLAAFTPALERSLTDQLLGADRLGLYAAGTKVAMLIGLVVSAFQTAWGPFSLSLYKQSDAAHTYNWVLKVFALGMCLLVLLLTLVAKPIIHLLASDRYSGAVVVVFPLAMGHAIQATSWITEIGIGISKRSYLNLYAYAVFVGATLGAILLLAPVLGLVGVSLGVLIGYLAKALISSWLAQRAYPLPWQYSPVVSIFILTLLLGFGAEYGAKHWGNAMHFAILIIGSVCLLVAGWILLFTSEEKQRVRGTIGAYFPYFRI
jgi:O-antigen/teichoic acid export membrane protein